MNVKGTRTEQNLLAAFQGESMARNKYLFFAEKARQEGHAQVAELFERLAGNEGMHGKLLYRQLQGIGSTKENLQAAAQGVYGEWSSMYPDFAKTAEEEGFDQIAKLFRSIAQIEQEHEFQFMDALRRLSGAAPAPRQESLPKTVEAHGYRCVFCGAVYDKRPDVCGVCQAIGSFEEVTYQKTK